MFHRLHFVFWALLFAGIAGGSAQTMNAGERIVIPFDKDWQFFKGDGSGAEAIAFDDSHWQKVDTPHDWSIEGPFLATNSTGPAGAFLPAGIGWYRKHLALPASYATRRIFVEFDGVMANSDVWINGAHLGKRPYGYVSFGYELTEHLVFGKCKTNILSVRADNSGQPASRWYTGAGIYRHVRIVVVNPTHFAKWGTFITTPSIKEGHATVRIQGAIINQSDTPTSAAIHITIVSPQSEAVASVKAKPFIVAPGETFHFDESAAIKNPKLWRLNDPQLYKAQLSIVDGNRMLDNEEISFGVREARFEPSTGFWLNNENIKIKGVCLHHDGSAFGAAVPLNAWERRLNQLRELGVNAIRTAHNPPAPEFLDLCDRMGFLVMDELFDCWTVGKTPFDYHLYFKEWSLVDVKDTVLRDRNHPSVILYSAGNEIHDTPKSDLAKKILADLVETFHRYDPSRPVTQALFRPNVSHDYDNGLADLLDVVGTNYRDQELLAAQKAKPERKIIGTEQRHDRETWLAARDNPQHAGQFLWSGIDYLGESFKWPVVAAGFGLLDRVGDVKPMAYERQSWWTEKPVVHIVRRVVPDQSMPVDPGFAPILASQSLFADWTPANQEPHEETIEAYSNCDEVELLLNSKSLGAQKRNPDDSARVWRVAWAPGEIRAIGRNGGTIAAEHVLRTATKPAKIILSADRDRLTPNWDSVAYVSATITDENGTRIPNSSDLISFEISGPGFIAAVDSADDASHETFHAKNRRAYQGRCYAIVKRNASKGKIIVKASAPGLKSASVSLYGEGLWIERH